MMHGETTESAQLLQARLCDTQSLARYSTVIKKLERF
jgi:hypothetical protein